MMLVGSIVALITPMQNDHQIDYVALKRLINWHIESGTDGIVLGGTTGESVTLTSDEYTILIERTMEYVDNRIPIIVGAGGNSTQSVIQLAKQAKRAGAQSILSVVPYYNKPTQEGIYQHFVTIAEAVDIKIVLYNVPSRTVADMHNETVLRLAKIANIIGIKDATANLARVAELVFRAPREFALYSGDDATAMAFILCGGHGAVSVCANIVPKVFRGMCAAALSGDVLQVRTQNAYLYKLYEHLFIETNPSPVKWVLYRLGLASNHVRLPLVPLSPNACKTLDSILRALHIL
jgi:4-hydroxy-tetrahydrodipicolinate synthase